jgi:hypothetical protein
VTTERSDSSNGYLQHGPDEPEIYTYQPRRRRSAIRPGELLLPVILLLGVVAVLRHFEQSTAG